jgi:exonuclease SbcD
MKFLHLADSHLGESMPLYRTPPENWRGEGFIKNYYAALKPALRGEVDFVLHAGDLFDKYHINMDIIGRAMVPLRKIATKEIPIFIVPGNHEREHIPGGLLLAGENIHIFSKPETVRFTVGEEEVAVVGFPFIRKDSRTRFRKLVEQSGWKPKRGMFSILLCHQTFEGAKVGTRNFTFRNGEHVVPLGEIPTGFDYIACGHIHKQQVIKTKDFTLCYSGSTEKVSFQEMNEEKGYYTVTVEKGIPNLRFNRLSSAIMNILEFNTTGKSIHDITDFLERKIKTSKPSTILRVHLSGQIDSEILRDVPLYLYKKRRSDVKVEFRKDNLVILKGKKRRFESEVKGKREIFVPQAIPINQKERLQFAKKSIDNAPISPGVYLLMDREERVLYIGKAKNLRNRLKSHLRRKKKRNEGFYFWLRQVIQCDVVETKDEFSALVLELSLIRSLLPPFNKQIKEYRNYVYLDVMHDKYFPIVRIVDEIKDDKNSYFGPFRKEYKVRENVKFIRELFGIRPCRRNLDDNLRLFSCPLDEMSKCDAPCTGGVSPKEYSRRVEQMVAFLLGKDNRKIKRLEKQKEEYVKVKEFEKASEVQKKIIDLTIFFNTLRKIRKATEINGTLSLDFGKNGKEKFPVINGRIIWDKFLKQSVSRKYPPEKWELDEMMLLSKAVEDKNPSFVLEKKK